MERRVDFVNLIRRLADTTLALHLDRFVRRLHVAISARAKEFDTVGVGPNGAMILLTLADTGTIALGALTKRMGRDKAQMSRAIHALEVKGMVARKPGDTDPRINMISITEAGMGLVEVHRDALAEEIDALLGPLSEVERAAFQDILSRVDPFN